MHMRLKVFMYLFVFLCGRSDIDFLTVSFACGLKSLFYTYGCIKTATPVDSDSFIGGFTLVVAGDSVSFTFFFFLPLFDF